VALALLAAVVAVLVTLGAVDLSAWHTQIGHGHPVRINPGR
jgi:hypothetical protein